MEIRDVAPGLWVWRVEQSSPITSGTSTCSSAATAAAPSARGSTGARTCPRPSSSTSSPARSFPAGSSRCTTGAAAWRRLWLPEQRALVFADALTAPRGELRVWASPAHEERALPALRKLLELPFEHVIVAHGEPVHDRAEYERALERTPWQG